MHIMIVGNSYSGKSMLAKRWAADAAQKGQAVVVYDPIRSENWPDSATKYYDASLFLDYLETAESTHVFIDEAKTLWDFDRARADKVVYQKRHQGMLVFLIAQRAMMVPPNGRNQCSRVIAFRQQKKDSEILAEEYTAEMDKARFLDKTHFIITDGYTTKFCSLDFTTGLPPIVRTA
jgi:hypothetical protein